MYKRILVPTDGSPIATSAVCTALDLARACGSEIVALSVAVPKTYRDEGVAAGSDIDDLERADANVNGVAARAQAAGAACVTVTLRSPSPAEAIIDTARDRQCDLIVMGSHGVRGLTRKIAGSVTQHVLAYSAIPVLVLRPASDVRT